MTTVRKVILLSFIAIALSSCNTPASNSTVTLAAPASTYSPVVDMSSLAGWGQNSSDQNVKIFTEVTTQGIVDNAIQISYDLENGGWVSIWKTVDPQVLSNSAGISFYYEGIGASNTLEVKLRLLYPGDTEETYFYTSKKINTDTHGDWIRVKAPFTSFVCKHPAHLCVDPQTGEPRALDPAKVVKIDFGIAAIGSNEAGAGTVKLDDVVGLTVVADNQMMLASKLVKLAGIILCGIPLVLALGFLVFVAFLKPRDKIPDDYYLVNRPWAYMPPEKK